MNDLLKPKQVKGSASVPLLKKKKEIKKSTSTPAKKPILNNPPIATTNESKGSLHKTISPQMKKTISLKLTQKKTRLKQTEDEDDEPVTKPISIAEKRARQAKRAYQVKIWRVREEREAREARSLVRKKIISGESKKVIETVTVKKKGVRFNLKKNKIIQITEEKM